MVAIDASRRTGRDRVAVRDEARSAGAFARGLSALGTFCVFTALALVLFWFGAAMFAPYEAAEITPMIENSPVLAWAYDRFSVQDLSNFIGAVEIFIGFLIVGRLFSPILSFIGGLLAAGFFGVTLSFMATTPGVVEPTLGFPALTGALGFYLLKDVVLFAASVMVMGRSLVAASEGG